MDMLFLVFESQILISHLGVVVEHEDLAGLLHGVVVPPLLGVVRHRAVQVVEDEGQEVDVEMIGNLVFWRECSGVHHGKWEVTNL